MTEPFRFVRLELRELNIPFRFSFGHALARRRANHTLILTLAANNGAVGFGEILTRDYLTGESVESARRAIADWRPRLAELRLPPPAPPRQDGGASRAAPDASVLEPLWQALDPLYREADEARQTAAYAGLDVAVVDAYARAAGLAGPRFFGGTKTGPEADANANANGDAEVDVDAQASGALLTGALGFRGPRATGWTARVLRRAGFRDFKIKLGRPDDEARLAAARRVLENLPLRADLNGAWDTAHADAQASDDPTNPWPARRALSERFDLDWIEQPVSAGRDAASALVHVREILGRRVMADESIVTRADAQALLEAGAAGAPCTASADDDTVGGGGASAAVAGPGRVDGWNLRVGKVGGFSGMRALASLARENGVAVHLGVLVGETSLLASAGRACMGLGPFSHMEYGFAPLLLTDDPFRPGPAGMRGVGPPLDGRPGLGVLPRPRSLARQTVRVESFAL